MKTLLLVPFAILFIGYCCKSEVKTDVQKVDFGIYEIVKINEIADSILDVLKTQNIQFENDTQRSIIGYIQMVDSMILQLDFSGENFKLAKTYYLVDNDQKYYAIVALKSTPDIDIMHIKKTVCKGNNVEIYFNMKGAMKWAKLTEKNKGNMVAFVIDNQVYSMPEIKEEIRSGVALINGLENENFAKSISESLNTGISY